MNVIEHYDKLIEENNDPVHDPKPLKDYMNQWDGQEFVDKMKLTDKKSVLEIGVGTGRIALKTAPLCKCFCGIDISPKTIERARDNLSKHQNIKLICDDFLTHNFDTCFDVIYSSLTFMHIKEKQACINKIASLLNCGGCFVLSIDKNQEKYIDMGERKLEIYPDNVADIKNYVLNAGLKTVEITQTEFAYILVVLQ
ncbi:MAG: class I SAM-dependent methyltransferase [Clostridia bacterium]|nr:class I SAM-dependent methyltransferase [Clostridia bacterium]